MSFLPRRRSLQPFHFMDKEPKPAIAPGPASKFPPLIPSTTAIENVPQKRSRYRTTSSIGASRIIRRVSSIFTPRKKAPPDLKLANSSLNNGSRRQSSSSSRDSCESEDDIRRPSGLGSAVSMTSNRSLPSPPESPAVYHTFSGKEFQRNRTVSSPNLLRSLSWKVRGKARVRYASIAPTPSSLITHQPPPPVPPLSPKHAVHLPAEIIVIILSHIPQSNVARLAPVSRVFASATRIALYAFLDFDTLSPDQAELLVAVLVSQRELTDLVTTFICRKWPPFFLTDVYDQNAIQNGHIIQHKNALLTASFTLALERMSNLHSLTLPSFDFSLLSHHSAFGLKSLTFLNRTMTDAETKALFTWLDGQTNITALKFTNLEDTHTRPTMNVKPDMPYDDNTRPETAPSSPYLKPFPLSSPYASPASSPRSACFHRPPSPPSPISGFASVTFLPNLMALHTTPTLVALFTQPLETSSRRPLQSVTLNINTTLYNGLRPALLMSSLRGVTHLSLKFSENVDRRSFEKVLGAAGASLGAFSKLVVDDPFLDVQHCSEPEWLGLRSLEISFHTQSSTHSGRDEALYKSLQASLARYKYLSSLQFLISSADDSCGAGKIGSASEQALIDSWVKLCPTLESITLFSGTRWNGTAHQQQKRLSHIQYGAKAFKFP